MVDNQPNYIFIFFFWVLHTSFSLLDYLIAVINNVLGRLRIKLVGDQFLDLEEVKKLSKIPKHIAFIVLEDKINYSDLARIIIWCIAAEINVISLFDMHGKLKRNQGTLLREVNKIYSQHLLDSGRLQNLNWRSHIESTSRGDEQTVIVNRQGNMYPDSNGNGEIAARNRKQGAGIKDPVTISLLSPEDGKIDIVFAARAIGLKLRDGHIESKDINEELVGAHLRSNKSLPDPCLIVRLGGVATNADFPPWQIRLAEIHSIPSHHLVKNSQLLGVLQKFGSCHQRFGK